MPAKTEREREGGRERERGRQRDREGCVCGRERDVRRQRRRALEARLCEVGC
jgi:hypothetical protein